MELFSDMRRFFNMSIVTIGLTLAGAGSLSATNLVGESAEAEKGTTPMFQVPADHAAMHQAVIRARRSVGKFIAALQHPTATDTDFAVKKPCYENGQVEHIWLTDVRFVGNRFQGRLDNQPRKITRLKMGDLVSVNPNEISDWMYVRDGVLVGGYTLRAHYTELTPQEKQAFDQATNFRMSRR